jgi:general stress protein CsbA
MTAKLAMRAIFITAAIYVAAILTFTLMGASREVSLFFGGSMALTVLALVMLTRGILERMARDRKRESGGALNFVSDPFLILVPGQMRDSTKAFGAAAILYFTKIFVFGDAALGLPPIWFTIFSAGG